jgi:hypothetical protein
MHPNGPKFDAPSFNFHGPFRTLYLGWGKEKKAKGGIGLEGKWKKRGRK